MGIRFPVFTFGRIVGRKIIVGWKVGCQAGRQVGIEKAFKMIKR